MKTFHRLLLIAFGVFLVSCATIPRQSAQLSEELGKTISNIEQSHLQLLHGFFDQKRAVVDTFITRTWTPHFSEVFFSNPAIEKIWDEIVSSGSKPDRLKFLTQAGPQLVQQIDLKRQELVQPLNELEKELEQQIRAEYNTAKSINNTLTSFLYSASKVEENRAKYMEMLGITDSKISDALDQTDRIVQQLVKGGEKTLSGMDQVNSYLSKLEEIKNKLRHPKN